MQKTYKSSRFIHFFSQIPVQLDLRLDTRSLSIMRIGMGLIMLASILEIWPDFLPFFTDEGIVPNSEIGLNLFSIAQQPLFNHLMFIILSASAFLFTCGYHTKIFGLIASIFYFNLSLRNMYVANITDIFIALTVFWLSILPSNLHLSLDSEKRSHLIRISRHINIAFIIQLLIFYVLYVIRSGVLSAQTIWYAKNNMLAQQSNTLLGQNLINIPSFIFIILSIFAIFTILVIPPAILLSKNINFKSKIIIWGLVFATILGLLKNLGLLPVTLVVMILGLVPAEFWESTPRLRITIADRTELQARSRLRNVLVIFFCANLLLAFSIIKAPNIFKPYKPTLWWQTILGFRQNGEYLSLNNDTQPFSKQKPVSFTEGILNYRWLTLTQSLSHVKNNEIIQRYSAPFCSQSKNLVFVQLFNYEQEISFGGLREDISQKLMGQKNCM